MIRPDYLKKGDKVGLIAPARKVSQNEIGFFREYIGRFHFNVVEGKYLFGELHQFSGGDTERRTDLQTMLDDPEIHAIFGEDTGL